MTTVVSFIRKVFFDETEGVLGHGWFKENVPQVSLSDYALRYQKTLKAELAKDNIIVDSRERYRRRVYGNEAHDQGTKVLVRLVKERLSMRGDLVLDGVPLASGAKIDLQISYRE